jgi:hypothetical protein
MTKYDGLKISCSQSAGINSAAALCYLKEIGAKPKELHLPYFHFEEHSPDSLNFVLAVYAYARIHFDNVFTHVTNNSVIKFFEEQKMIPHPMASPCSRMLKIIPMMEYNEKHGIELDLVGYVKKEKKRMETARAKEDLFNIKDFPIELLDDEECFEIVDRNIGWHPAIYDLKWNDVGFVAYLKENIHRFPEAIRNTIINKAGKDIMVFKHNNCLPCKNMSIIDMIAVEYFYPSYFDKSKALSDRLRAYWGRNADEYYTTFGKQEYEAKQCEVCSFD